MLRKLRTHGNSHIWHIFHIARNLMISGYDISWKCYSNSSSNPILTPQYGKILSKAKGFHTSKKVMKEKELDRSCGCNSDIKSEKDDGSFTCRQGWNNRLLPISYIGFQGAPFNKGQVHIFKAWIKLPKPKIIVIYYNNYIKPKPGVAEGPFVIRETGIIKLLREEVGQDIIDFGDIPLTDTHHHKSQKKTETEKTKERPKKDKTNKVQTKKEEKETLERKLKQQNEFEKRQRRKIREIDKAKNGNSVYSAEKMGHNFNKVLKYTVEVAAATKLISDATTNILRDGRICVTLGGDHSISIGSVNGVSQVYEDLALLWIDAHTDINTFTSTTSGNLHGTPVAFCVIEMQKYMAKIPGFEWVKPKIKAENVAYIATRCVDPDERMYLDLLGIRTYDAADVDRNGAVAIIRAALERISPDRKRPIHVSFDIDSLDNLEVVSTGTPVPGGLTLREAQIMCEEIYKSGVMVSMDLVEVNPEIGTPYEANRSADCAARILYSILGGARRGIADPDKSVTKMPDFAK